MALYPQDAGRLYLADDGSDPTVWFIDTDGSRRGIPNPQTLHNLFRDGAVEKVPPRTISDYDLSPLGGISDGAILARAPNDPTVWVITDGVKRGVSSQQAMDKFHFARDQVQLVPFIVLSYVPVGTAFTD